MYKIIINGTFDLLHHGHLDLIDESKKYQPGFLLVLIDSDRRVQERKGLERPINDQYFRKRILESLKMVDQVRIFDSDEELIELIKDFEPHIMIKGSDYLDQTILGSQYCQNIIFVDHDGRSSSEIIKKLKEISVG
jgi:rfaE bifunctional protein nucleotidyltransferase chain/domain